LAQASLGPNRREHRADCRAIKNTPYRCRTTPWTITSLSNEGSACAPAAAAKCQMWFKTEAHTTPSGVWGVRWEAPWVGPCFLGASLDQWVRLAGQLGAPSWAPGQALRLATAFAMQLRRLRTMFVSSARLPHILVGSRIGEGVAWERQRTRPQQRSPQRRHHRAPPLASASVVRPTPLARASAVVGHGCGHQSPRLLERARRHHRQRQMLVAAAGRPRFSQLSLALGTHWAANWLSRLLLEAIPADSSAAWVALLRRRQLRRLRGEPKRRRMKLLHDNCRNSFCRRTEGSSGHSAERSKCLSHNFNSIGRFCQRCGRAANRRLAANNLVVECNLKGLCSVQQQVAPIVALRCAPSTVC